MTLYEQCGMCPLSLWLEYHENRQCQLCPMEDGVDIGVGWQQHCNYECRGGSAKTSTEEELF